MHYAELGKEDVGITAWRRIYLLPGIVAVFKLNHQAGNQYYIHRQYEGGCRLPGFTQVRWPWVYPALLQEMLGFDDINKYIGQWNKCSGYDSKPISGRFAAFPKFNACIDCKGCHGYSDVI